MIPDDLLYTTNHEWIRFAKHDEAVLGITDHAQRALGDITFVGLPETGRRFAAGEACAVAESIKAASDIYTPFAGVVTKINKSLSREPERINKDPYKTGWICRLSGCETTTGERLMNAMEYRRFLDNA